MKTPSSFFLPVAAVDAVGVDDTDVVESVVVGSPVLAVSDKGEYCTVWCILTDLQEIKEKRQGKYRKIFSCSPSASVTGTAAVVEAEIGNVEGEIKDPQPLVDKIQAGRQVDTGKDQN